MRPEDRDAALLLDMLNAARSVIEFAEGKSYEQYNSDLQFRYATERLIEIVGEAARGVSESLKADHPDIPWKGIIAQRHVLAHEYGRIKNDRIWDIISTHLPGLIKKLEPLIPPLPDEDDTRA